ncbi:MAG: carboxylating nicotinate-nucleotide diphosphorylase [Candidatus Binatus sp.]|uniref:carboxylating nicotinate-nucleotide diphosphorylase n=1 Tax=Candidatus Binatus sp. TaxID=2811406 RepID=UPI0027166A14|nr:carboxylating nicotinate-nucleotide diphosphorylase [Candidatus Binatus sp.]MDO8433180.1 carboxylating nicotinate-nucleotide diphosphorylase [Candidatus Binatus sp.]
MELLRQIDLTDLIRRALAEDLGQGDITTASTVAPGAQGRATIRVKEPRIILAGGVLIEQVMRLTGTNPRMTSLAPEGAQLKAGDTLAVIEGNLAGLLIGERTALNFVQLLSGVATTTRTYVDAVAGTRAKIIDTRKTHPGLRLVEKYAVRVGGGHNHRVGLDSGVLIKENHIAAAGSVTKAIQGAHRLAPHTLKVEIECETLAQVEEALGAGADAILLDNMPLADIHLARALAKSNVLLEVSGGVSLDTVRGIAETGVDLISVGALTHSARFLDISMRIQVL